MLAKCRAHARSGRVVVFDTETTGICRCDQIVQIAAAEYVGGELTRTLMLYVKPTCAINPFAEAVHHLSWEFLQEHGVEPVEALAEFFEFLGEGAILVGHNIRFDLRMLDHECCEFGFGANIQDIEFADTLSLARKLLPGLESYRLCNLIAELGLEGDNTHDALDDTLACANLFFRLMETEGA